MKIATFTDHIYTPSSRFRIRQYFSVLESNGIAVHDYYRFFSTQTASTRNAEKRIKENPFLIMKALLHESRNIISRFHDSIECNKYDLIWLSRQLVIGYPTFELLIKKPLIYDIDDSIFLLSRFANLQFKICTQRAVAVIAGNDYLAEEASKYCKNTYIIPTSVDINRWKPLIKQELDSKFTSDVFKIGWSGTSTSYKYFIPLEKVIKKFLIDFPSAKLIFMADRFPHELKILNPYIQFVDWNEDIEVEFIQSLDVGLMPIAHDKWSEGKCAYKSLLYSACGIPVVITPTGVNKKLLGSADIGFGPVLPDDWYQVLQVLFLDRLLGKRLGGNGIELVKKDYSIDVCAPKIIEILKQSI
jgi:glycosyltransferase involved in cell wall biosynthesis